MNDLERSFEVSIKARGPMSIARWMRDCLTHPAHGYYQKQPVFGATGDFTTSVELSNMFNAMVGVWVLHMWRVLGSPEHVNLIEFGPGRGELMGSVCEAIAKDVDMKAAAVQLHLLEKSEQLRAVQQQRIGGDVNFFDDFAEFTPGNPNPCIVLAHEFFDALPIYRFQHREEMGWCEELVDVNDNAEQEDPFRLVLSPGPTPPVAVCLGRNPPTEPSPIEVSPDSQSAMAQICKTLHSNSGVALVIDYGDFGPASNSLRAIRNHKFVPIFESAGECDLSADVDFRMLSNVAKQHGLTTPPMMTQQHFLRAMGIEVLLVQMLNKATPEEGVSSLDFFFFFSLLCLV